jgi:HAMP domain-containing protein
VREAIEQKDWSETKTQIGEVAAAVNRLATYLEAL